MKRKQILNYFNRLMTFRRQLGQGFDLFEGRVGVDAGSRITSRISAVAHFDGTHRRVKWKWILLAEINC
jgi:hypothetical protein